MKMLAWNRKTKPTYKKFAFHTTLFNCLLILFLCAAPLAGDSSINYKALEWGTPKVIAKSPEIPFFVDAAEADNKVFFTNNGLWMMELTKGEGKLLFKNGVSPEDIFLPLCVKLYKGKIYVNSNMPAKNLYCFSPSAPDFELELKPYGVGLALLCHDFIMLSENKMLMAIALQNKDLIRIFDFEKHAIVKAFGKPTFHPLMRRFNVNRATVCILDKNLYVVERIVPKILIFSMDNYEAGPSIELAPPFYEPMPKKYKAKHREWMASWSGVFEVNGDKNWLLIKYRWGYGDKMAYELINLNTPNNRLYLPPSSKIVYDFKIEGNRAHFKFIEDIDEELLFQHVATPLK